MRYAILLSMASLQVNPLANMLPVLAMEINNTRAIKTGEYDFTKDCMSAEIVF